MTAGIGGLVQDSQLPHSPRCVGTSPSRTRLLAIPCGRRVALDTLSPFMDLSPRAVGSRAVDALDEHLPSWAMNLASRALGTAARVHLPTPIHRVAVTAYARATGVDLREVGPTEDTTIDAFFTRSLRPGARSIARVDGLVAPCDGVVTGEGAVGPGARWRVKGQDWRLEALLGEAVPQALQAGRVLSIYLGPADYHRVHAPCDAILERVVHLPGERRRVDASALRREPARLALNERLVMWFDGRQGPMAVVMVAAAGVGHLRCEHVELGATASSRELGRAVHSGDELGRFHLGSSVVLVVPASHRARVATGERVTMGAVLTRRTS